MTQHSTAAPPPWLLGTFHHPETKVVWEIIMNWRRNRKTAPPQNTTWRSKAGTAHHKQCYWDRFQSRLMKDRNTDSQLRASQMHRVPGSTHYTFAQGNIKLPMWSLKSYSESGEDANQSLNKKSSKDKIFHNRLSVNRGSGFS